MTSRERILAVLAGKPTDRVPVAPFAHESTVRAWRKAWNIDVIEDTIRFCETYGFDVIHRNFPVRFDDWKAETPDWRIELREERQGDVTLRRHIVRTPGGNLSEAVAVTPLTPYLTVTARKEAMVKTAGDFELLRRYQPPPTPADLGPLRRVKIALGEKGVTAPWVSGVFNYMADLRDLEELLTDPYEEPAFYDGLARYALDRLKEGLAPVLDEGVDLLSYAGNIASATMVGPRYFEAFVLPYEKELIDFIQARGTGVLYHNCGDGEALIGCYAKLGMRCCESMSEPPYGDNRLETWAGECPQEICLMGNIDQISFLKQATPAEVTRRAEEALRIMEAHPRFMLGTSDFLEDGTPEENLRALARAVQKEGLSR